jgi:hypothetical protein
MGKMRTTMHRILTTMGMTIHTTMDTKLTTMDTILTTMGMAIHTTMDTKLTTMAMMIKKWEVQTGTHCLLIIKLDSSTLAGCFGCMH